MAGNPGSFTEMDDAALGLAYGDEPLKQALAMSFTSVTGKTS